MNKRLEDFTLDVLSAASAYEYSKSSIYNYDVPIIERICGVILYYFAVGIITSLDIYWLIKDKIKY
jgi:hypothetical protein